MGIERDAAWYDDMFGSERGWRHHVATTESPWKPVWDWMAQRIGPDDLVLDAGCGTGGFVETLYGYSPRTKVVGIDFSKVALETARKRNPLAKFELVDLNHYQPEGFTVVCFSEVLEHVQDDIGIVGRIPPGTRVLISAPTYDDESHVRHYNGQTPVGLLDRYSKLFEPATIHVDPVMRAGKPAIIWCLEGTR